MIWTPEDRAWWLADEGVANKSLLGETCASPLGTIEFAGYLRHSRGVPANPMRVYGRYALVYLLDGSGLYRDANGVKQRMTAGDAVFVLPELAHSYRPGSGEHWTEFHVVFDGPVFDLCRDSRLLRPDDLIYRLVPINEWIARFEGVFAPMTGGHSVQRGARQPVACAGDANHRLKAG